MHTRNTPKPGYSDRQPVDEHGLESYTAANAEGHHASLHKSVAEVLLVRSTVLVAIVAETARL